MAQVVISHLPPLPNGTGSGSSKGTDLFPATDVTDTSSASTGTTKKYTLAEIYGYMLTAQGLTTYSAVRVATTLALTVVYNNGVLGVGATLTNAGAQGAITIDGVALSVGDRVLVKNQGSSFQNGIYVVTTVGTASTNWVMTRATDYDQSSEIVQYGVVLSNQGTTNAGLLWQETGAGPWTIGTTPIVFAAYTASFGSGSIPSITGTASQVLVNGTSGSPVTGVPVTLTTPQSIATTSSPTFAALTLTSPLLPASGGTGVNNGSSTLTLGGNLATSGAFASTFTMTGATSVTFPTSGTLATTSSIPSIGDFTFSGDIMSVGTTNATMNINQNGTGQLVMGKFASWAVGSNSILIGGPALSTANFANNASPTAWNSYKTRSTSVGTHVAVQSGDNLLSIAALGDDGTNFVTASTGSMKFTVNGTVSTGIIPTQWTLSTVNTSGNAVTGMTLSNAQVLTLANPLAPSSGGTGINNGSSTLTLAGNLATSGAFASTFTMTGVTNVTFPTSGTLATTASASGIVNNGTANQLAYYATTGNAVSGLTSANNGLLITNGSGVPSIGNTLSGTFTATALSAAAGNITALAGNALVANSTTASMGLIALLSPNNAGNFSNILTNAATSAARTWTLPDATGTIALTNSASSGYVLLSPSGDQTITSNNLILSSGGITTSGNISAVGGALISGSASGVIGAIALFPAGASTGSMNIFPANGTGNFANNLTNISTTAARTWSLPDATGTVLVTGAAINSVPSITFSSTSGIIGTTTNDNAAAGSVGEYQETVLLSSGSLVPLTSGVAGNIVQLTNLSAGDWDVWGNFVLDVAGVSTITTLLGWVSSTSATAPNIVFTTRLENQTANNTDIALPVATRRFSLSAPTTIYLSMLSQYTGGTVTGFGAIYARRRR